MRFLICELLINSRDQHMLISNQHPVSRPLGCGRRLDHLAATFNAAIHRLALLNLPLLDRVFTMLYFSALIIVVYKIFSNNISVPRWPSAAARTWPPRPRWAPRGEKKGVGDGCREARGRPLSIRCHVSAEYIGRQLDCQKQRTLGSKIQILHAPASAYGPALPSLPGALRPRRICMPLKKFTRVCILSHEFSFTYTSF